MFKATRFLRFANKLTLLIIWTITIDSKSNSHTVFWLFSTIPSFSCKRTIRGKLLKEPCFVYIEYISWMILLSKLAVLLYLSNIVFVVCVDSCSFTMVNVLFDLMSCFLNCISYLVDYLGSLIDGSWGRSCQISCAFAFKTSLVITTFFFCILCCYLKSALSWAGEIGLGGALSSEFRVFSCISIKVGKLVRERQRDCRLSDLSSIGFVVPLCDISLFFLVALLALANHTTLRVTNACFFSS